MKLIMENWRKFLTESPLYDYEPEKFAALSLYHEDNGDNGELILYHMMPSIVDNGMYIVGYFEIRMADSLGVGFGYHKMNLLSIFDPVNSYPFVTFFAIVFIDPGSEPESGSVKAAAGKIWPVASPGKYFFF